MKFTGTIAALSDSHFRGSQWGDRTRSAPFADAAQAGVLAASKRGVRILCHGGDIFQSNQPEPEVVHQLRQLDKSLRHLGMVMFLVSGNHDGTQGMQWPEAVLSLKANEENGTGIIYLRDKRHDMPREGGFSVVGVSPIEKGVGKEGILKSAREKGPATVLICHAPVQEFTGSRAPTDMAVREMPVDLYGAIVVGDTHEHAVVYHPDYPNVPVVSPGSTEIHTADEATYTPDKFVTFLTFADGVVTGVEKVALPITPCRTFNFFREDLLPAEVTAMVKELETVPDGAIVRARYHRDINPSLIRTVISDALVGRRFYLRIDILPGDKPADTHATDAQAPATAEEDIDLTLPLLSDSLEKWPSGNDRLDGIRKLMLSEQPGWEPALDSLIDDILKGEVAKVV